ncbi:hypothetical protein J437_LFUL005530 [Ladona fulva]|uniref:Uncharacterized protein n=1 Tax=Ladona fulva TaxID=123851 RepID=A0A8K0NZ13_LADFU|nr:hypothetical protein J437_LFUL005530 [Ladona fulva]
MTTSEAQGSASHETGGIGRQCCKCCVAGAHPGFEIESTTKSEGVLRVVDGRLSTALALLHFK